MRFKDWILDIFGGVSWESYNSLHNSLGNRFEEEYWKNKYWEKEFIKMRNIAIDLASKYQEEDKIDEILVIGVSSEKLSDL